MDMTGGLLDLLHGMQASLWGNIGQWVFFDALFSYLDREVIAFQQALSRDLGRWVGSVALVLLSIWIMWQGFLIVTGRSKESMMALVANSGRQVVIVVAATTLAISGGPLYQMLCGFSQSDNDVKTSLLGLITSSVVGEGKENPYKNIDNMMTQVQAAMTAIDAVPAIAASMDANNVDALKGDKDDAQMWLGLGVAGPSVVSGALLFMYKMAMALFVGLGPIFILSLLFEQTKGMFQRWLWYGVGTMFSLAVLALMVAIVQKVMLGVLGVMLVKIIAAAAIGAMSSGGGGISLGDGVPGGVTSLAMQQGGLGMLMTVMLISIPPMAAAFFQGAVVNGFSAYSQFGQAPRGGADPNTPAGRAGMGGGAPSNPNTQGGSGGGTGGVQNSSYSSPTNIHGNRASNQNSNG
ncbi:type IV secretion system protein [Luteimonas aquatica]|uniref:type IV secretion system protein n=1 Tax=Luteimonas aquatica TaxID=450364 RepID=UPI001F59D3BF|nr:type IV secretion system protein [Luteimonas aquatica]